MRLPGVTPSDQDMSANEPRRSVEQTRGTGERSYPGHGPRCGIYLVDEDRMVMAGYRDVRDDEFWVRGHIPGRPIFPGVLMIETAAQLVSYYAMRKMPKQGFLGFGGVDDVKFRGSVVPGDRIVMVGKMVEVRRRRCVGDTQAFVNGNMVYEGRITGMWL